MNVMIPTQRIKMERLSNHNQQQKRGKKGAHGCQKAALHLPKLAIAGQKGLAKPRVKEANWNATSEKPTKKGQFRTQI